MPTFVGADISKKYFDAYLQGRSARYTNDKKGFKKFIAFLSADSWVLLESTGTYGLQLAEELDKQGFSVSVVNPIQVKRFAQSRAKRAKTDKTDAKLLTEYALSLEQCESDSDRLRLWKTPTQAQLHLKQLKTTYDFLMKNRTMTLNQLEALEGYNDVAPCVRQTLGSILKTFDKKIADVQKAMNLIVESKFKTEAKNIESIPGVARKTAIAVLAAVGDIARFASAKAFAAFCGLAPSVKQSGSSVFGSGVLSNFGNLALRSQLYMCAMSAARWNPACKELYQRLLNKGKQKKVAILAVAHKLARQIYAMLKFNLTFDPNWTSS